MISRIYVIPLKFDKKRGECVISSYLLEHTLRDEEVELAAEALTNKVLEKYALDTLPANNFSHAIEVGFKPGVTDNVSHTVKEVLGDLLQKQDFNIYSSKVYLVKPESRAQVDEYAATLYNSLIERVNIVKAINNQIVLPLEIPRVILGKTISVSEVNLNVNDQELAKIGTEGIANEDGSRRGPLALDADSMNVIKNFFNTLKRNPTDIELESLAQTWSEHCKHTIFANPIDDIRDGLYKTYIKGATNLIRRRLGSKDFCVSVFSDNAGGIVFDNNFLITHKVETHNTPSALDPFGGAITGIVGVNRDCLGFGVGAKPVANTYGFCFGNPEDTRTLYRNHELSEKIFTPKRIMQGVIKGINHGGNCSGIPTTTGFVNFDDSFRGKPLVFAGTVGLIPRKIGERLSHEKAAKSGDLIVMIGGRVGADGIHGATFSSVHMDWNSPSTAVQIGDPITQKKFSDAIVKEARALNLYSSITDNGAGGLSCSVAEMARECGGAKVELERVPLKYPGLQPWEIWISESQERMTLAVPPKKWEILKNLLENRGVEATVIGEFTNTGKCVVTWQGKNILDLPLDFLHNGLPKKNLVSERITKSYPVPELPKGISRTKQFLELLSAKNVSGHAFISEQYDHEVQATSVIKPLTGRGRIQSDAQVIAPVLGSTRGVVLSAALYPTYSEIGTYEMAQASLDTAVRNAVSAGAKLGHLAILDNFCWSSSNDKKRLGELVLAVKACYDGAVTYNTPFISGKDSMFNDFNGYNERGDAVKVSALPTLLISAIGVVPDVYKTVTPEFKNKGDYIYLVGKTKDELGGSEYYKMLGRLGVNVPKVDLNANLNTYKAVEDAIENNLLASAVSVSHGGMAIALAKSSIGGLLGVKVQISSLGESLGVDAKLFSESQGRILVSVSPKNVKKFEKLMSVTSFNKIGTVSSDGKFTISQGKTKIVGTTVNALYRTYHTFSNSMK